MYNRRVGDFFMQTSFICFSPMHDTTNEWLLCISFRPSLDFAFFFKRP